jgi:signal transduction histidine kinase
MRGRILRATVAAVVCAVLLFAVPLGAAVLRLYRQDEVRELQQLAQQAAVSLPVQVGASGDPVELPRTESDTRIAVYDSGGRRVTGAGPATADGSVRAAAGGHASSRRVGDRLVVAVPVGSAEQVRGIVRVSSPAAQPLHRAALTWAGMLLLAAVAVGVAVLLAVRSSRRLARPLESLAATAHELESGNLAVRAAPSGLPEADGVANALNRATDRIDRLVRRERSFSADASHQLRTALTRTRLDLEAALAAGAVAEGPTTPATSETSNNSDPSRTSEGFPTSGTSGGSSALASSEVPTASQLPPSSDASRGARAPAHADPNAAIRSALAELSHMESTIGDLLALARDVPERAALDIGTLLAEAEHRWHGELAAAGRPLRIAAEPDLPEAVGSSRAARQVLDVLLANATAHGTGTVTVRARETAGVVAVDVEDEGPGVPDGVDVFARRQGADGGHGIGLALARSLAETEGGRLLLSRRAPHPRFTWLVAAAAEPSGPRP